MQSNGIPTHAGVAPATPPAGGRKAAAGGAVSTGVKAVKPRKPPPGYTVEPPEATAERLKKLEALRKMFPNTSEPDADEPDENEPVAASPEAPRRRGNRKALGRETEEQRAVRMRLLADIEALEARGSAAVPVPAPAPAPERIVDAPELSGPDPVAIEPVRMLSTFLGQFYRQWSEAAKHEDRHRRERETHARLLRSALDESGEGLAVVVDPADPLRVAVLVLDDNDSDGFQVHDVRPVAL